MKIRLPSDCLLCGKRQHEMLCSACQAALPWRQNPCWLCGQELASSIAHTCGPCLKKPPPWERLVSPWHFEDVIPSLVHRFKFGFSPHLARYLGQLMAPYARDFYDMDPVDLIAPVPLHRFRQTRRLYNQSEWIARALSQALNCPLDTGSLRRVKFTRAQAKMNSPSARCSNVQSAFRVKNPPQVQHIALVDDVSTTGATAAACIRAWQAVSPARFSLWCLARGEPKRYSKL